MATNPATTTAPSLQRGTAVRFLPYTRKRRITVLVDGVTTLPSGTLCMVHGVRLNAEGRTDSQARRSCWPVQLDTELEVLD